MSKFVTDLPVYTTPQDVDVFLIVDISAGTSGSKQITYSSLKSSLNTYFSGIYVTPAGTTTLTNKTLGTGTKILLGSDATGDVYYNSGSGTTARLGISTDGKVLMLQSGLPSWQTPPTASNATNSAAGLVELATAAEINAGTATGSSGPLVVTPDQLALSAPVFSGANLTNLPPTLFPYYQRVYFAAASGALLAAATDSTGSTMFSVYTSAANQVGVIRYAFDTVSGQWYYTHSATFILASGNISGTVLGVTVIGSFVYVSSTTTTPVVETWRLSATDLSGGTQCTYSGGSPSTATTYRPSYTDGTDFYVCSTTTTWKRYTISGTTLTFAANVTTLTGASVTGAVGDGTNVFFTDGTSLVSKYTFAGSSVTSITRQGSVNEGTERGLGVCSTKSTLIYKMQGIGTTSMAVVPTTKP